MECLGGLTTHYLTKNHVLVYLTMFLAQHLSHYLQYSYRTSFSCTINKPISTYLNLWLLDLPLKIFLTSYHSSNYYATDPQIGTYNHLHSTTKMTAATPDKSHLPGSYNYAKLNRLTQAKILEYEAGDLNSLFVYGSLMLPDLAIRRLEGIPNKNQESELAQRMTPGTLNGFIRQAVRNSAFPAISDKGGKHDVVEGMVIFGLTDAHLGRLDRFEGGHFSREMVSVRIELANGSSLDSFIYAYVFAQDESLLLDPAVATWSLELFVQTPEYHHLVRHSSSCLPYFLGA